MKSWSRKQRVTGGMIDVFHYIVVIHLMVLLNKAIKSSSSQLFDDKRKRNAHDNVYFCMTLFITIFLSYRVCKLLSTAFSSALTPNITPYSEWINEDNRNEVVLFIISDHDKTGALGLDMYARARIRALHKTYSIIFRMVSDPLDIETTINGLKSQGKHIKILTLIAHSDRNALGYSSRHLDKAFLKQNPTIFSKLDSDTQIIIDGCEAGNVLNTSDSSPIAQDISNAADCKVFASDEDVTSPLVEFQLNQSGSLNTVQFYKLDNKSFFSRFLFGVGRNCTNEFKPQSSLKIGR